MITLTRKHSNPVLTSVPTKGRSTTRLRIVLASAAVLAMAAIWAAVSPPPAASHASDPPGPYVLQASNCNKNFVDGERYIIVRAPKIYPQSGHSSQSVKYIARLYKLVNGSWVKKAAGPSISGTAYTNSPFVGGNTTARNVRATYGSGTYRTNVYMSWWNGGSWGPNRGTYINTYYNTYFDGTWHYTGTTSTCVF